MLVTKIKTAIPYLIILTVSFGALTGLLNVTLHKS